MTARYRHEVRVLDTGELQPRCLENGEVHWSGEAVSQKPLGAAWAYDQAGADLAAHVAETGHDQYKRARS